MFKKLSFFTLILSAVLAIHAPSVIFGSGCEADLFLGFARISDRPGLDLLPPRSGAMGQGHRARSSHFLP